MNTMTTITDKMKHRMTWLWESVRMDIEPKSVLHTSPARFDDAENLFIRR